MLVLSRKLSQQILIGSDIAITVVKIEGNQVRLGIEAPHGVSILRQELVAQWCARSNSRRRPGQSRWRSCLVTGPAKSPVDHFNSSWYRLTDAGRVLASLGIASPRVHSAHRFTRRECLEAEADLWT